MMGAKRLSLTRLRAAMSLALAACALACAAFALAPAPAPALADEGTYVVRVFAGNRGLVDGCEVWQTTVAYGTGFVFDADLVEVTEEKYYVRGVREAGLDNASVYAPGTGVTITEDTDFVVAYGIKSSAVRYTVRFHTQDGKELAPDKVFFGNVGDKPVVAFAYVEGYQPQAYKLTKTLVADEAENVFTFTYTPVETTQRVTPTVPGGTTPGGSGGTTPGGTEPGGTTPGGSGTTPGGTTPGGSGTEPGGTTPGGTTSGGDTPGGSGTEPGGTTPGGSGTTPGGSGTEPQEIIDLDNPTTDGSQPGADDGRKTPIWPIAAGIFGGAAALALLIAFLLKRRKDKEADQAGTKAD